MHFFKNYYFFLFSSFPQRICFLISDVFSFSSNLSHPTSCLLRKQVVAPSTVLVLQSEWRSPNWFLTSSGISAYNKPEPLHCKTKVVIFLVISLCFNSFIDWWTNSPFSPNLHSIFTSRPFGLGTWHFDIIFTSLHVSHAMCHLPHVKGCMSPVTFQMSYKKKKLKKKLQT